MMKYEKQPLTIAEQITRLKGRGLIFQDEAGAARCLSSVSYYRLRAYTYPFQDNTAADTPFITKISFEEIFQLYTFDHKLRSLVFEMLGVIEVAVRTQIIYKYSLAHGSHWQLNPNIFRDTMKFANHLASLQQEIERSNEKFIFHYQTKYNDPAEPASWMSLEVSSFGLLSKIFQNLKKGIEKEEIALYFGLHNIEVLENWIFCFSNLRNLCAHHSRLWNRRLTAKPKLPTNPVYPFVDNAVNIYTNKLYATLCCMIYILNIIRPHHNYTIQLQNLLATCPLNQTKEMGFPSNWTQDPIWQKNDSKAGI